MQPKMKSPAMTGIALTMAVGAVAAYAMHNRGASSRRRAIKRTANKASRVVGNMVGDVVGNVYGMMR